MRVGPDLRKAHQQARANADWTGKPWGVFHPTGCGSDLWVEEVNARATYEYVVISYPNKQEATR